MRIFINIDAQPVWLIRGYTGHEMLPEFGLINMNGRLYDPVIGRMLSPDNYVQDATSVMGFNRYVYVRNNPLKYTDPEGEVAILDDVLAIVIGGAVNVAVNWKYITAGGKFDWGKAALFFGVGAFPTLTTMAVLGVLIKCFSLFII